MSKRLAGLRYRLEENNPISLLGLAHCDAAAAASRQGWMLTNYLLSFHLNVPRCVA